LFIQPEQQEQIMNFISTAIKAVTPTLKSIVIPLVVGTVIVAVAAAVFKIDY
jgi:predicted DNA repair protein MutK